MQENPSFILLTFTSHSDSLRLKKAQVICQTEEIQKQLEGIIEKIRDEVLDQAETLEQEVKGDDQ